MKQPKNKYVVTLDNNIVEATDAAIRAEQTKARLLPEGDVQVWELVSHDWLVFIKYDLVATLMKMSLSEEKARQVAKLVVEGRHAL